MKKTLIIAVTALLWAGCEKEIAIDLDYQEPHVVVKAAGTALEPLTVNITKSKPVFGLHTEGEGFPHVTDATVTLTVNGGAPLTATGVENNYTFGYLPTPGDSLKLRVEVPGFDPITAADAVPLMANISEPTMDSTGEQWGYPEYTVRFTLDDPAGEGNYYSVRLFSVSHYHEGGSTFDDTSYLSFSCNDILLTSNDITTILNYGPEETDRFDGFELFFTDESIDGRQHNIELKFFSYGYSETDYYLEVDTYTRDMYLYRQTMDNSMNDLAEVMGYLSEPVQIHSNLEGGWGIFAFRTMCKKKIQ